jgi:subfamily B ATP-binding cassette protein MsbA
MREAAVVKKLFVLLRPSPLCMSLAVLTGGLASVCEAAGITLFIPALNAMVHTTPQAGLPHLLQRVLPAHDRGIFFYILLIFGVTLLKNVLNFSNRTLLSWMEGKTGHALRCRMFRQLLTAGNEFWDARDPGRVSNALANESWRASQAIQLLSSSVLCICTILVFTFFLFLLSWRLTCVVIAGLLIISVLMRLISLPVTKIGREAVDTNAELGARMWDGVTGIRTIQAFCLESIKQIRFAAASERVRRSFFKLELISGLATPLSEILFIALLLGVLAWRLPAAGSLPGTLVFLLLLFRLQPNVSLLQSCMVSLTSIAGPLDEITELLDRTYNRRLESGNTPFHGLREGLTFHEVSFRYSHGSRAALQRVTMHIAAGRTVIIAGSSGAGKSTFAHLLCRFLDATSGSIKVDGIPLTEFDLNSWRGNVALASQDTHLFSTTIGENIALGRDGATMAQVIEAATLAGAHEFIEELPEKYETAVGERGIRLSGGQRQRIALARALIRKPDILILDEASNALDSPMEATVMANLRALKHPCTLIVITHRPAAVGFADHAIVLDRGKVIEEGSPAELMDRGGRFHELCRFASESLEPACDTPWQT